ncbi:hypothetical protein ACIQI7_21190 [Kitasatospora sp. NPDC092039]|uniref:hypothetical protein n=1 Tax=Kitasatospora sp. NPDC092039 TaxID=3364086 RepID=UPI0037FF0F6F
MPKRPTDVWREHLAEEAAAVAAGTLAPEDAYSGALFPVALLTATDDVLAAFETDVAALGASPADDDVLGVVERVVLELNRVHEAHDEAAYETEERELLCAYIDDSLVAAGVDVAALTERQGLGRHEITDRWRDW